MAADQGPRFALFSAVDAMLRDHMVQLAVWVLAIETVIYAVPLLEPADLAIFGTSRFEIPFVATAAAAAFYGLGQIEDREERRFWNILGVGCLVWLATLTVQTVLPHAGSAMSRDVALDAGYLTFYGSWLLAVERAPHIPGAFGRSRAGRRMRWAGLLVLALGWFVYFVVAPVATDRRFYDSMLPSSLLFMLLDAAIAARFLTHAAWCGATRWRVLYGALGIGALTLLGADALDALIASGYLTWPNGTATDLLWTIPALWLVVAFRLRHVQMPRTPPPDVATQEAMRDLEPVRVGSLLVAGAFSFPLIHFAQDAIRAVSPALEAAEHAVVLAGMTVLGLMAVAAYRRLERERVEAERARMRLEERLREAKKMEALGRLASVVTHEFLNLLNAIGGYIDLTLDSLGTDHPESDNLRRAHDVVHRTTGFTKHLLILSRGRPFQTATVPLNQAIRDVMPEITALAQPPIRLETKLRDEFDLVDISADYLREVMLHLVGNACDAMERGGTLTIETARVDIGPREAISLAVRPGTYGKVIVRDTGSGIPKDGMAHLFEPFYTTKPKPRGRGLGLATVYVVVNQHAGTVSVTSQLGVGTTVEFLVPAPAAASNPPLLRNVS